MYNDFAVVYFGLTRSTKKVYQSHIRNIFDVFHENNLSYKIFMHTWKTADNRQRVWENIVPQPIDYTEYKHLNPDFYTIDDQEDFINTVDMDKFFYKHVYDTIGHSHEGEWLPGLVRNHLCALESKKRGLEMVESYIREENTFKYVMFVRPDVLIVDKLPLREILPRTFDISIPNDNHHEGYNDRFAILPMEKAHIYGKRIDEIADFRKSNGRIVSEKYVKFIIQKYKLTHNLINFRFNIVRP